MGWGYVLVFHGLAWLVYAIVYYAEVRVARPADYWQVVAVASVSGSLLCGLLAFTYAALRQRPLPAKIAAALAASLVVAVLWTLVKHLFFDYVYAPGQASAPLLSVRAILHSLNALLFWSALYFFYDNYRLAREHEIRSLRAESLARENQLKLLSYQLNPHFLFNVLNSIAAMALKKDSRAAHDTTVKLAEFLRYTLDSEPWRKVTLAQELECIERYLDIQTARFEDRLSVHYEVPAALRELRVPNLILQPLIENAVKHTLAAGAEAVSVTVGAREERGKLLIEMNNSVSDGRPSEASPNGAGWGLSNVEARLRAYYGDDARMTAGGHDHRYSVILELPLEPGDGRR